jgi:hypothetical protein
MFAAIPHSPRTSYVPGMYPVRAECCPEGATFSGRELHETAERVHEAHVLDRAAADLQQLRRADQHHKRRLTSFVA